ncbi:MAG: CAP domain-containing protein [Deltaproteobacteria bacterium]|jgi:uncharacterized protein YkwD|nr:CAP domain-containing protein [Deltaproteobacteria bacterium]
MTKRELNGFFLITFMGLFCFGVITFNALGLWAQTAEESPQPVLSSEQLLEERRKLSSLVNEERRKKGLAPLAWDDTVADAAQVRAEELGTQFLHYRPKGRGSFLSVLEEFGIETSAAGELLSQGHINAQGVMEEWMSSEPDRDTILSERHERIGVGASYGPDGNLNWEMLFVN